MAFFVENPEPLVKKSALEMLEAFADATPVEHQAEFMARPLAVAIGLNVEGLPTGHKHRKEVREFVKTHFKEGLAEAGKSVIAMLLEDQREKTAHVLMAYRSFLLRGAIPSSEASSATVLKSKQ